MAKKINNVFRAQSAARFARRSILALKILAKHLAKKIGAKLAENFWSILEPWTVKRPREPPQYAQTILAENLAKKFGA